MRYPILLLLALFVPLHALAGSESSEIAQLRSDLAALQRRVDALTQPAPAPRPSLNAARSAAPLAALFPGVAAMGGVPPFLAATISGGGGPSLGSSPTWTGAHTFSGDVTLNGGTGALGFGAGETIVPVDGTLNVTGAASVSGAFVTGDSITVTGAAALSGAAGVKVDKWQPNTASGNPTVQDNGGNVLSTFFDDGTTGYIQTTSTKQTGTITLSAGTGTATVRSGATCVCSNTSTEASVKCAVAATTLTADSGAGADVIAYWCN